MEVTTAPQASAAVTAAASSGGVDLTVILVVLLVVLIVLGSIAGMIAYFYPYFSNLYKYREREKYSLGFVLLQITVPRGNEIKIDEENLKEKMSSDNEEDGKSVELTGTVGITAVDKLKKIPSDNRRKRNYRINREQLLKYCVEAIQHNNELTVAELSNLISRNLGIETNQEKTEFYRYLYQFISNRSKKNIDIIKDNNYLYLKKNEEVAA